MPRISNTESDALGVYQISAFKAVQTSQKATAHSILMPVSTSNPMTSLLALADTIPYTTAGFNTQLA